MYSEKDLVSQLEEQPINEPVEIDGESVYLKVGTAGAELGAYLFHSYRPDQLQEALKHGFSSAISFEAGLAQAPDGNGLVLTQWLPNVTTWGQAIEPLENLLNQMTNWRALLAPVEPTRIKTTVDHTERRLRSLFAGARK